MMSHPLPWVVFLVMVLALLALDLFVLHKNEREIRVREALIGAGVPVILALVFMAGLYYGYQRHWMGLGVYPGVAPRELDRLNIPDTGPEAATTFISGYLIELALSADNVFLFAVLLNFFKVTPLLQHRVLFWGILGALAMRAGMIILGVQVLHRFEWLIYVLGVFLIVTAFKMFRHQEHAPDPSENFAVRTVRRLVPVTDDFHGNHFFVRIDGRRFATPLLLVLVVIEITDVVFALDSIPAIFGITRDPFIVFTSNVFAVLGLRSLYFLLAKVIDKFHYLKIGLAVILLFVGIKMLLPLAERWGVQWKIPTWSSLVIILLVLAGSIGASWFWPADEKPDHMTGPNRL